VDESAGQPTSWTLLGEGTHIPFLTWTLAVGACCGISRDLSTALFLSYDVGSFAFQDASKMAFVSSYMQLMDVYEARCEALHASVDAACEALVAQSRIPELTDDGLSGWAAREKGVADEDGIGAGAGPASHSGDGDAVGGDDGRGSGDDDTEEDLEVLQRRVRRKFVAAMEQLQSSQLPKRRRGNLPKEATAVFRSWFAANLDHPYPSDAVKADLSRATGTGVAQVSNWLINYRYVQGECKTDRRVPTRAAGMFAGSARATALFSVLVGCLMTGADVRQSWSCLR